MSPQLDVFAGPNGAGKSTFSQIRLGPDIPVLDGDKEFALLKSKFDSTDSGTLYDAVNGHIFENWKNLQLDLLESSIERVRLRVAEGGH